MLSTVVATRIMNAVIRGTVWEGATLLRRSRKIADKTNAFIEIKINIQSLLQRLWTYCFVFLRGVHHYTVARHANQKQGKGVQGCASLCGLMKVRFMRKIAM